MNDFKGYFLRKLDKKSLWTEYSGKYNNFTWLKNNTDIPADPISNDLKTQNNSLSLYLIEEDKSNLNRIVAALGSNRKNLQNFDYVLIDSHIIYTSGLLVKKKNGNTVDNEVNTKYHFDLNNVSGLVLIQFAKIILDKGQFSRVYHQKLLEYIASEIKNNSFDINDLNDNIKEKVKNNLN